MHWRPNGYTLQLYANALNFLRKSSLFKETGWLFGLYYLGKVGWPLTDFRSFGHDNLAKSLQMTVGLRTGLVWVDVHHYNPGQSFTGLLLLFRGEGVLWKRKTLTKQLCSSIVSVVSPHNMYVWRAANRVCG